ncbi:DNA repair protein RecO [Amylibacter marinus]|uniref:DNA repair protein RecO n=1 Tax=Amylibacter marinus TaxID=1475483 RepID=A0ABQ5VV25_9RHOB|nr:DNA repair protein RecO [Amylibacter marinus]GLQ35042.1 DNA repair protein RecO [Amylibacter marinus]
MDWSGEGVILSVRKHGETSAIIDVFTPDRGRHAGVVRAGASRKMAPILQPGTQVAVEWRARLEEHLGSYRVEPLKSRANALQDRLRLAGLTATCALACFAFPERMELAGLYARTIDLMDRIDGTGAWADAYALWELSVLEDLGHGLDLSACAASGVTQDLIYVSPRTGRAVSRAGGAEWADRLLPLPDFLRNSFAEDNRIEVLNALKTTGHFLETALAPALGNRPLPAARDRLMKRLEKDTVSCQ